MVNADSERAVQMPRVLCKVSKLALVASLFSTPIYFPVSFALITNLQQPVLGIVPLATIGTNQVARPTCALAIVVLRNCKRLAAAAGDKKHS